jgi:hypothetical protein
MEWIITLIVLMIMPLGMIFWWIPHCDAIGVRKSELRDISAAARAVVKICEVRRGSVAPARLFIGTWNRCIIELISLTSYGKMVLVKKSRKAFDPKAFLAKVGDGKTISNIRRIRLFFRRVPLRTRFFTFRRAKSSLLSFPSVARRQSLEFWDRATFLARDVSTGIRYGSQQLRRSSNH